MSNKERRKAPVLRFKGFTDDWEQRKLNTYLSVSKLKNKEERFSKQDVLSVSGDFGIVNQIKFQGRSFAGKSLSNYKIVKNGDIVYTKSPLKAAPYGIIKSNGGIPGIVSTLYAVYTPKKSVDSKFVELFFNDQLRLNRYLKPIVNIGAKHDMKVKNDEVINHFVTFPNKKEQLKISKLLQKMDDVISLQQRKMNKFQSIKMAILSRIFADKGKTTLFFNDSNATWKEIKLGNIATIIRGASPRPIADSKWFDEKSKVGWLRISDVTSQHGRIKYLEQHLSQLGEKKTRVLKTPHLLLSIAASVGYPVINYVPTGVHDGFLIFKNPQFQLNYGFYWLQSYRNRWQKYGQPGSQVNLNSSIVENTIIDLPSEAEQKKIVSLLFKVDHLILTQKDKISSLKQVKNFLLQNLFI